MSNLEIKYPEKSSKYSQKQLTAKVDLKANDYIRN